MNKHLFLSLFFIILFERSALSIEPPIEELPPLAPPKQEVPAKANPVKSHALDSFLLLGSTSNAKTESKMSFLGTNSTTSSNGKGAFAFGVDTAFRTGDRTAISFLVDGADYVYESDGSSDALFFIGLAPRVELPLNMPGAWLWANFGVGYLRNRVSTVQQVSGNYLFSTSNSDASTLGLSPRLGVDIQTSEKFAVRLQVGYTWGEFSYDFNVKNYPAMTNVGDGTMKLRRSWYTTYIGFAWSP